MTNPIAAQVRNLMRVEGSNRDGDDSIATSADLTQWISAAAQETALETLRLVVADVAKNGLRDAATVSALLVGLIRRTPSSTIRLNADMLATLRDIYPGLNAHPTVQCLLLRLCLCGTDTDALKLFSQLLVSNKPLDPRLLLEVFGDLLRLKETCVAGVFPLILDGLEVPGLASYVLDYANYAYRHHWVSEHPATSRSGQLTKLLSELSDRLGQLQDTPPNSKEDAIRVGKQVTDSVALGIALCDAAACIGDVEAVASLNKALEVEHRRLRVEAAAALAKLGVEDAKKILTAMAADPIERLRVLSYAEELDLIDEVDEEFSNIVARAEAEFVMHLAQPGQMGIAPQHIELIDQREQAWPGYEETRNCFLFQFAYDFPGGEFTNIGIAGPVVMTFDGDLTALSTDDIYALFAGWHVEHTEIFAVEAERAAGQDEILMHHMKVCLTESDEYEEVIPALLGWLFERRCLVASARRSGEMGWAIVSDDEVSWLPLGTPSRPLGAQDAFHLFVGRSLLRSFN